MSAFPTSKRNHQSLHLIQTISKSANEQKIKSINRLDYYTPNKALFWGEEDQLAELVLMKSNIRARNLFILHAEVPVALYEDSTMGTTKKRNQMETKETTGKEENIKKKTKVQVHNLLIKHFQNGIWKYNPRLRVREICNFANVLPTSLLDDPKACLLAMLGCCTSNRCHKTHHMATDEEAKHIVNLLDKAIKNPEQICQPGAPAGEKNNY